MRLILYEWMVLIDPSKPTWYGIKGRLASMTLTKDESEWDGNVCKWNEVRFVWKSQPHGLCKIWLSKWGRTKTWDAPLWRASNGSFACQIHKELQYNNVLKSNEDFDGTAWGSDIIGCFGVS